jgi:hypothetical protein
MGQEPPYPRQCTTRSSRPEFQRACNSISHTEHKTLQAQHCIVAGCFRCSRSRAANYCSRNPCPWDRRTRASGRSAPCSRMPFCFVLLYDLTVRLVNSDLALLQHPPLVASLCLIKMAQMMMIIRHHHRRWCCRTLRKTKRRSRRNHPVSARHHWNHHHYHHCVRARQSRTPNDPNAYHPNTHTHAPSTFIYAPRSHRAPLLSSSATAAHAAFASYSSSSSLLLQHESLPDSSNDSSNGPIISASRRARRPAASARCSDTVGGNASSPTVSPPRPYTSLRLSARSHAWRYSLPDPSSFFMDFLCMDSDM